jgi:hypothetical protein
MKTVPIIILIFLLFLGVAGGARTLSALRQQESGAQAIDEPGTLKWHVKQAKLKGKQQVTVSTPIYEYAGVQSLDEAVSYFHVVIAKPIEKRSYVQSAQNITTWYKFKVVEDLSLNKGAGCSTCGSLPVAPGDMLPLKEDEILIPRAGGTVVLDGIEITKEEANFPQFSMAREYLLFFSPDPSKGIGKLSLGPYGVYVVNPAGKIEPINGKGTPLRNEIQRLYHDSLDQLKAKLKKSK